LRPLDEQARIFDHLRATEALTAHYRQALALAAAIALYRTMEMTFWLPQAEAALAEVEGF
jgi:hypothetical protein